MKITYSILGLTAGAALFLANGCGKEEQPSGEAPKVTPPVASDTQKAAETPKRATEPMPSAAAAATAADQAASAAASEAQKTVGAQKAAAESMPSAAAANQAASAATSDAQKAVGAQLAATPPAPPTAAATAPTAPPSTAATALQAVTSASGQTSAVAAMASSLSTTNSLVEGLINNAKGLVTNQKYQDALNVVQQLSSLKLTPEQQAVVDGLKTQIQTALAKAAGADAASALGNVLGGKK
jgi:hypothetical protein